MKILIFGGAAFVAWKLLSGRGASCDVSLGQTGVSPGVRLATGGCASINGGQVLAPTSRFNGTATWSPDAPPAPTSPASAFPTWRPGAAWVAGKVAPPPTNAIGGAWVSTATGQPVTSTKAPSPGVIPRVEPSYVYEPVTVYG